MKIKYDNHPDEWDECLSNPERKDIALSWLQNSTFDNFRHNRVLKKLTPLLDSSSSWLTIGDGRFGTDAHFLLSSGVSNVHCSDISDTLLKHGHSKGFINEYSVQNAESLTFDDDSFDFVLIKESLHHFPRPYTALHEAFRVASKAVIVIDNSDDFSLYSFILCFVKSISSNKYPFWMNQFLFEPVGNFVYKTSKKELSKFMLGLHYRHIAFNYTCDVYEEGVEMLDLSNLSPSDHLQLFRLRFKLIIKQLLAFLGLKKGDFFSAILFKSSPSPSTFKLLKSYSWEYVKLPRNPYV